MYLGQVGRGHHSWFILLDDTEAPDNEIHAIQKKYPKDSIVLVAHKKFKVYILFLFSSKTSKITNSQH